MHYRNFRWLDTLRSGDSVIRSLRIKLQNDYRRPRFIATVPGKGYRFVPTFSNQGWDAGRTAD